MEECRYALTRRFWAVLTCGLLIIHASGYAAAQAGDGDSSPPASRSAAARGVIGGGAFFGIGRLRNSATVPVAQGVAGAKITVMDAAGKRVIATAVAGRDGSFRIEVAAGDYLILWGTMRQYIRVGAGETVTVNFASPNP